MKRLFLLLLFTYYFPVFVFSQPYSTGLVFDVPSYRGTPYKARMTTANYTSLPAKYSMENYAPTPGDQGPYGTCTAFATAYHARTIMTAKMLDITDKARINELVHSPTWVYELIKDDNDKDCSGGSNPITAMELLKVEGCPTLKTLPYTCSTPIPNAVRSEANQFRLLDYNILFLPDETDVQFKVNSTRKALSEGTPVILCFKVPDSFYRSGAVWIPQSSDTGPSGQHGLHAMCIVGYDDGFQGGAFRVLNSWGPDWADNGYVWIKYKDYADWAIGAIQGIPEPIKKPEPAPKPQPQPQPTPPVVIEPALAGSLDFRLNTGENMPVTYVSTRNLIIEDESMSEGEDLVAYRMINDYYSGTRFRFLLSTNEGAYVYAFATDLTGKVNKLLPFEDGMSPYIGPNSQIAFPSETKVIKMDDNPGTDYLLILFSTEKLDANAIYQSMRNQKGGLSSKIKAALGNKLVPKHEVIYGKDRVGFEVKSEHKGKVVPLMVELTHK